VAEAWGGAQVFDRYGVGDTGSIAAEGPTQEGLHIWEDAHVVEIIDPQTLERLAAGQTGNICVTCLFKTTVYPVIRFNTNDLSRLLPPAPATGINFRRLEGFLGRSDNMVKLRGVNVYPTAIAAHLAGFEEAGGEYVCRLQQAGGREELIVMVEVKAGREASGELRQRIAAALGQQLGLEVGVALVGPGGTAALTQIAQRQKPIRLVDERS
jgi:phenylacetate-CoA ligase